MSTSQLIQLNPILKENEELQNDYKLNLIELFKYLSIDFDKNNWKNLKKWCQAEYKFYSNYLNLDVQTNYSYSDLNKYHLYMILDIIIMLGLNMLPFLEKGIDYNIDTTIEQQTTRYKLISYFNKILANEQIEFGNNLIDYLLFGDQRYLDKLKEYDIYKDIFSYISHLEKNLNFINKKPFQILVTALMSAGKSTFINAVTGKNICKAENQASTSKIHSIIAKSYEDNLAYKYDYELTLKADKNNLLNNDKRNLTDKINVSTYFDGELASKRIIINDSPGVNASEHEEHRIVTENMIKSDEYDLIIYLLNYSNQLSDDEIVHLNFVKDNIKNKEILFLVNKIDEYDPDDKSENYIKNLETIKSTLEKEGFQNPKICPISAKAVSLFYEYKENKKENSKLLFYINILEKINLSDYYKKEFPNIIVEDKDTEEEQLLKTSGIEYVCKIIKEFIKE